MSYATKYQRIHAHFNHLTHFEDIMTAIDEYFGDVFNLEQLNKVDESAPFYKLFASCLNKLQTCFTSEEIRASILRTLHEDLICCHREGDITYYSGSERPLYLTSTQDPAIRQVRVLEKLVSGQLSPQESLTSFDMFIAAVCYDSWRGSYFKNSSTLPKKYSTNDVYYFRCMVSHLSNLQLLLNSVATVTPQLVFINLSANPHDQPVWGVLFPKMGRKKEPFFYCEVAITEQQKNTIEQAIGQKIKPSNYNGGQSDLSFSTGYTAFAWADERIFQNKHGYTKNPNALTTTADFPALYLAVFQAFLKHSAIKHLKPVFTPTFTQLVALEPKLNKLIPKILLATTLDYAEANTLTQNDFNAACEQIVNHTLSRHRLRNQYIFNTRLSLPAIRETLTEAGDLKKVRLFRNYWYDLYRQVRSHEILSDRELAEPLLSFFKKCPEASKVDMRFFTKLLELTERPPFVEKLNEFNTKVRQYEKELSSCEFITETADTIALDLTNIDEDQTVVDLFHSYERRGSSEARVMFSSLIKDQHSYIQTADGVPLNDIVTAIVLSVMRSHANKAVIDINFPHAIRLDASEINFILHFLKTNGRLTQLIDHGHPSLVSINEANKAILARNRWLAKKGYRAPLADNYWAMAAKYWLLDLPDQARLAESNLDRQFFKHCVTDMGNEGLIAVLTYLCNEKNHLMLDKAFDNHWPRFFIANANQQSDQYLALLLKHLDENHAFPFSEVELTWQPQQSTQLHALLERLNHQETFQRLIISDFLIESSHSDHLDFLQALTTAALKDKWTSIIDIPVLEHKNNIDEPYRQLRAAYLQLNNIIIQNAREKQALIRLKQIENQTDFSSKESKRKYPIASQPSSSSFVQIEEEADNELFTNLDPNKRWPLKRGGDIQLQIQQQIQVEQNIQVSQKNMTIGYSANAPLNQKRVDYESIDRLLHDFYEQLKKEQPIHLSSASLKTTEEQELQGFFHTWINANPNMSAQMVIKEMTLDAAKQLLRHHRQLISGLNPKNLPKGFYTQRNKDDQLVLCYDSERRHAQIPTPLTVELDASIPSATGWKGDFRQFALDDYLTGNKALQPADWQRLALFFNLQATKDYQADYTAFRLLHKDWTPNANQEQLAIQYWPIFIQAWLYAGQAAIEDFFTIDPPSFELPAETIASILFEKQVPDLKLWAQTRFTQKTTLIALGQLYQQFGDQGLMFILRKFKQMDDQLGQAVFEHFIINYLNHCEDFTVLMTEGFFKTMDRLREKFSLSQNASLLTNWQALLSNHMQALDWEKLEALWSGYSYFIRELEQLGLSLPDESFQDLPPQNMLVLMDRLLTAIKSLSSSAQQAQFLRQFKPMDLTHGGVAYALSHEGFNQFESALELHDFAAGEPTYSPDQKKLDDWSPLELRRAIASHPSLNQSEYDTTVTRLADNSPRSRQLYLWLSRLNYAADQGIDAVLDQLKTVDQDVIALVAQQLQRNNLAHSTLDLNALCRLNASNTDLLSNNPDGVVLECLSLMSLAHPDADLDNLNRLFDKPLPLVENHSYLRRETYKLCVLFNNFDSASAASFYNLLTENMPVTVLEMLPVLFRQLSSIDLVSSNHNSLSPANWQAIFTSIQAMKNQPSNQLSIRAQLIESLGAQGLVFELSKTGHYKTITQKDLNKINDFSSFPTHEQRLKAFFAAHIAMPMKEETELSLQPILRLLQQLQNSRSSINEIEPLLALLEKTPAHHYWSASYFYQLLQTLQPSEEGQTYPVSLIEVVIHPSSTLAARSIHDLEKDCPSALLEVLQTISANAFTRAQQALLCQIALKQYAQEQSTSLLPAIIEVLEGHTGEEGTTLLTLLNQSQTMEQVQAHLARSRRLLHYPPATSRLWLKAMSMREPEIALFEQIMTRYPDLEKSAMILHIIAWSCFEQDLRDLDANDYRLNRKAPKLVEQLDLLEPDELTLLSQCYPGQPAPRAETILQLLKQKQAPDAPTWNSLLTTFLKKPHNHQTRADYHHLSATRETDFLRMLQQVQQHNGEHSTSLSAAEAIKLTQQFMLIKALEAGTITIRINDVQKSLADLSQDEITAQLKTLALQTDMNSRTICWALLFETIARTTKDYPHLSQQFALLANDLVAENASSRVVLLPTGDGKSHYFALRAARLALEGKTVDICTAKKSLAQRDLDAYQPFFTALQLSTARINQHSSLSDYQNATIHYSTMGELSLLVDNLAYQGESLVSYKSQRVGLFDEFDFIFFDEGYKTEYNYAIPTAETPKQRLWFYQALNQFYQQQFPQGSTRRFFNKNDLMEMKAALIKAAGVNEERQQQLEAMTDPLQWAQWLQSAYQAHQLQQGIHYTLRSENIAIGDEYYPMQEIYPLSTDNQLLFGATFSNGVHQLLADLENTRARANNKSQNIHVHHESHILSSQVAASRVMHLWGAWEGVSATLTPAENLALNQQYQTRVLQVSTNRNDLRLWHKPLFFKSNDDRLTRLVETWKGCATKNQSVLFSCKNDQQVQTIKQALAERLTPEELDTILFYTNEDPRSPAQVLAEKQDREHWRSGKKQQGISLMASGFSRGDNVDVEATFLFDACNQTEIWQKGGRTARNGEEGEVYSFYLEDEINTREDQLESSLRIAGVSLEALDQVKGDSDIETKFKRLLLLQELEFNLQNQPNQRYHRLLADFSTWAMNGLGWILDRDHRHTFMRLLSDEMKFIEQQWLNVSGEPDAIESIAVIIKQRAEAFQHAYEEKNISPLAAFVQAIPPASSLYLLAPKTRHPGRKEKTITRICQRLLAIPYLIFDHGLADKINEMAEHEALLEQFADKISTITSAQGFLQQLNISHAQSQSSKWSTQYQLTQPVYSFDWDDVLQGITAVRVQEYFFMSRAPDEIKSAILNYLNAPGRLLPEARLEQVLAIATIIMRLPGNKMHLAPGYIELWDQLKQDLIGVPEFEPLIPARHLQTLLRFYKQYPNETALSSLIQSIQKAPEKRLLALERWEAWKKQDPSLPLQPFLSVMTAFNSNNWHVFQTLMQRMDAFQDKHLLWQELAAQPHSLSQRSNYLLWALKQGGKSSYQLIQAGLQLDAPVAERHLPQFADLWQLALHTPGVKKQEQMARFGQTINSLNLFYAMEPSEDEVSQLANLDSHAFSQFLDFVAANTEQLRRYPALRAAALGFASAPHANELLALCASILDTHRDDRPIDAIRVRDGLHRVASLEPAVLIELCELINTNPGALTMLLFNNVAAVIQSSPAIKQPLLRSAAQTFYTNPLTVINRLEALDQPINRQQMKALMHLIHAEALVTEDGLTLWSKRHNNALQNQGFETYVNYAKTILEAPGNKTDRMENRDLRRPQLTKLRQLTADLQYINDTPIQTRPATAVSTELNALLNQYANRWFKSDHRDQQLRALRTSLDDINNSNYESILGAIQTARLAAITQDRTDNQQRFFKLNRGGASRYYTTLNKIEDLIIKHWVQNRESIPAFQHYQEINRVKFEALRTSFLALPNLPAHLRTAYENTSTDIEALAEIINQTREALPRLPGEVATLAKEILAHGEALTSQLDTEDPIPHRSTNPS